MIKKKTLIIVFSCFSAQETFAQSKEKGKQIKKVPPKWKLKVLTPKNQSRIKSY
jgi:hypothetical protein